jgi:hypothetical protein
MTREGERSAIAMFEATAPDTSGSVARAGPPLLGHNFVRAGTAR